MKPAAAFIDHKALDAAFQSVRDVEHALYEFNADLSVITWACDELWHHSFRFEADDSNERISRLPVALFRMISSRSQELHRGASDGLATGMLSGPMPRDGMEWLASFAVKETK